MNASVADQFGTAYTRLEAYHLRRALTPDVEDAVRRKASLCIFDHLACCLEVQTLPWARAVTRLATRSSTTPEAIVWGSAVRAAAGEAAFANGTISHGLIQDDMHVPSGGHLGVVILPAMLALAQRNSLSGRALLAGIVAGYDAMGRVGKGLRAGVSTRHFRPSGLSGAYGVAVGAAAALDLNEEVTVNALGFAGNFACGLNEWPWSGGQEIFVHAGVAARNGLLAIDLALEGLVSSEAIVDGRDGMFAAYGSGFAAAAAALPGANGRTAILDVEHKAFPGCSLIQSPIGAALALRGGNEVDPDQISSVVIRTHKAAQRYPGCDNVGPFTRVVQAKMSLQFGVAAALLYGQFDESTCARFGDPDIASLVGRCRIETVSEFDAAYPARQPAEIQATLTDGRVVSGSVSDVPWLSAEAVRRRFANVALHLIDREAEEELARMIDQLWEMPSLSPFFEALSAASVSDV